MNNPINLLDPSGLDAVIPFPAAAPAAEGVSGAAAGWVSPKPIWFLLIWPNEVAANDWDPTAEAANDDTYNDKEGSCNQKVGETIAPPPSNCAAWKAQIIAQKENAQMLFLITEEARFIANVNYDIQAYNASCKNVTGEVELLFVDLDSY